MIKKILKVLFPYSWSGDGAGITKQDGFLSIGAGLAMGGVANIVTGVMAAGESRRGAAEARASLDPFRTAGLDAIGRYQDLLRDPSSIRETPGYQFRLEEGLEGVMRKGSAVGKLFSGEAGKALTTFGQEYATAEYDKALQREQGLMGIGLQAAGGMAGVTMQGSQGVQSAYGQMGQGLGTVGSAGAYGRYLDRSPSGSPAGILG